MGIANIATVTYADPPHYRGTGTRCVITLDNGFAVYGDCIHPMNDPWDAEPERERVLARREADRQLALIADYLECETRCPRGMA